MLHSLVDSAGIKEIRIFQEKKRLLFCEYQKKPYLCTRYRKRTIHNRNVAQLVAHYVRDVGVGRSSRLIPT